MTPTAAPRTALVTGAARRIGEAIARDLAAHGWAVAVHYKASRDTAETVVADIARAGGRAVAIGGDLADLAALPDLVAAATAALGPIGLLVNNASEFEPDEIGGLDAATMMQRLALDLASPCLLTDAWVRALPAGMAGSCVHMIDQRVLKPVPGFFTYTLAKSALWTATRTMAQALAPRIRVNAIGPGPTFPGPRQSVGQFERQVAAVPLARGPGPEEFGRTVRYFAETPSVTGQMICLDGGQHLAWATPDAVDIGE
ncbi:SDR family oxidoreductase [Siculibacillus lacustris]|uniref:SDR family oxidoreductase n=1 Tax=Siculibacillus lacustris TaxID=1549641 RepID=A0A4Q9VHS7_9HYPH|nr:SDR family oxidoreductase [Siculibacillus lacustris]TBW34721.1 SDR family oxidoreductase [Siculibacillus lacustris]